MSLPPKLNIDYKNRMCKNCEKCEKAKCPHDAFVRIRNGALLTGVIDKVSYQGILLDTIFREFGPGAARKFLDESTQMVLVALMDQGFTTSVANSDISEEANKRVDQVIKDAERDVNMLIKKYDASELKRIPGKSLKETLEDNIMAILGKARADAGKIAEADLGEDNSAIVMSRVGSRGGLLNVTQMSACVGQQAVRGGRVLRGYRNKSLPHFKEGDIGIDSRGFVRSSFKKGLNPIEYFFHGMGGREGLVDKGIRTAKSGYMQRRLINALQDLVLRADGTVRDATDVIVQFKYGDDGVDPMRCYGNDAVQLKKEIIYYDEYERDKVEEEIEEEEIGGDEGGE
jgi:DNA-directed RNA polymerase subunit A'